MYTISKFHIVEYTQVPEWYSYFAHRLYVLSYTYRNVAYKFVFAIVGNLWWRHSHTWRFCQLLQLLWAAGELAIVRELPGPPAEDLDHRNVPYNSQVAQASAGGLIFFIYTIPTSPDVCTPGVFTCLVDNCTGPCQIICSFATSKKIFALLCSPLAQAPTT